MGCRTGKKNATLRREPPKYYEKLKWTSRLPDEKILMFVGDIYEDLEVWYPKLRLIEAGAQVVVAGPRGRRVRRKAWLSVRFRRRHREVRAANSMGWSFPADSCRTSCVGIRPC